MLTYKTLFNIDLIIMPILKLYAILYNSKANTLLMTFLHLVKD